jgi:hypothetical protein
LAALDVFAASVFTKAIPPESVFARSGREKRATDQGVAALEDIFHPIFNICRVSRPSQQNCPQDFLCERKPFRIAKSAILSASKSTV